MIRWHVGECPPAPWGLVQAGPLIAVRIGRVDDFRFVETSPPETFPVQKMMVDTGAAFTLVNETVPVELGLRPIRYREVIGVGQTAAMRPVFRLSLGLEVGNDEGNTALVYFTEDIVGMPAPERPEPYVGLLGRDFLRHYRFVYDGPQALFRLIYDPGRARRSSGTAG